MREVSDSRSRWRRIAGVLLGIGPALKYAGPGIATGLGGGGRSVSHGRERNRAQNVLGVAQVALALVLLVSSGLMIRTFEALREVEPGVTDAGTASNAADLDSPAARARARARGADPKRHRRRARRDPERNLSRVLELAADGRHSTPRGTASRSKANPALPVTRRHQSADSNSFPPRSSRPLAHGSSRVATSTWTDIHERRPVAMVSENLARELWSTPAAALGERDSWLRGARWHEVIGVVQDVRDNGMNEPPPAIVYWPVYQARSRRHRPRRVFRSVTIAIRSPLAGTEGFLRQVQQAVWSVNPESAGRLGAHDGGRYRGVASAHVVHSRDARDRGRRGARARHHRSLRRALLRSLATAARNRDSLGARRAADTRCGAPSFATVSGSRPSVSRSGSAPRQASRG